MRFDTLAYLVVIFGVISVSTRSLPPANGTCISWSTCPDDSRFECAKFPVPLDYKNPAVGQATLAVARLQAKQQPRLGSIFTNPGGPGDGGVGFLVGTAGDLISTISHGQYDIVSWDPRGVNGSRPLISCGFTTADSLAEFFGNTIPAVGIEARGNFTDQDDLDAFFSKVNETDAKVVQTGQRCLETDGAFLKFMGTASVVRDMVSLADCLEGPERPINYWGFSYGTVIGNYFVNMFPKRVGRVIIDGVVDTVIWSTQPSFKPLSEAWNQSLRVWNSSTADTIVKSIKDLIDTAYDLHKAGKSDVSSFEVRQFIDEEMFDPTLWDGQLIPQLEIWAAMFENQTTSSVSNLTASNSSTSLSPRSHTGILKRRGNTNETDNNSVDPNVQLLLSELVISCVDSIDQQDVTTERVFQELVRVTHEVSPTFGETLVAAGAAFCHRFPIRAVERFQGPFNHELSNPILIIGNKADPITPLANARKIAGILGKNARLLEQDGFGHTSIAMNSDCTQNIVRDYFLQGKLPKNGTVCATDQALFPPNSTLISPNPLVPLVRRQV